MSPMSGSPVVQRLMVAAALGLAVVACGGAGQVPTAVGSGGLHGASSGPSAGPAVHNDADAMFVSDMIPHHEGAVSMSELAVTRAETSEVKDLAERIAAAQEPEIELMEEMAGAWGVDLDAGGGGHAGHGMGSDDGSAELERLSGQEFDRAFLASMIEHHEGAIPMSRRVLSEGENARVKQLAQDILTVQEREIAEMEQLLEQL